MVAGGEQSGYGILTVREQLWMFSQFYGLPSRDGWRRVDELIEAVGLDEQRDPAGQHALDRPAPEDELRPRPAQRPVDLLPRRADARPRRLRRPLGPRAGPRVEGRRARADGPAHDPLHGRGRRALRADRDRRPRPDPRPRHARRAEAPRPARVDLPARARPARRRRRRAPARCPGVVSAAASRSATRPTARTRARRSRSTSPSPTTPPSAGSSVALGGARRPHPRAPEVRALARGRVRRARRARLRRATSGRRRPIDEPRADASTATTRRPARARGGRPRDRATPPDEPGRRASRPAASTAFVYRPTASPQAAADWTRRQVVMTEPADDPRPGLSRGSPGCSARRAGSSSRSCCRSSRPSAFVFVYRALQAPPEYIGFVVLGGAMTAFWLNVIWMMAAAALLGEEPGQPGALLRRADAHHERPLRDGRRRASS